VVRDNPEQDAYLDGLLRRVGRERVVSGIGERPAVVHMRDFGLPGFTTGSGCIASELCSALFAACREQDWVHAEAIRSQFIPFEDLRDEWGPARVLHQGIELAGISPTGPIPPFVSALDASQVEQLAPVARALREATA
jgi:dihydrodipicolinate synthase/N-acetylneuraminate lyase